MIYQERFWAKVDKRGPTEPHMGSPCWIWTACTNGGYGILRVRTHSPPAVRAHRLSWSWANGPIPEGMFVLHECDVRRCVNPGHLFLGTNDDNVRDMVKKGRTATGDKHGLVKHPERRPRGDTSGASILTERNVREIREVYRRGDGKKLADMYGVGRPTIYSVVRRETWKHVA